MNTILLIESDPDILENFTEYFEMEGFKILSANNGTAGVEIAREFLPDLIISAIFMHGMDGHQVLRLLLATPKTFRIPFIFCTTKCQIMDRIYALNLGADDYVVKPASMEHLSAMANTWIKSGSNRLFQ